MNKQVQEFYNKEWKRFDVSRVRIWKEVQVFTSTLSKKSTLLDVGCGNGKNIKYMLENGINASGIDFSEKLVQVCQKKGLNATYGDVLEIPFPDDMFDNIISIAVIHHLQKETDRIQAINEMIRVCKPGGKILISVWSVEQTGQEIQNRTFVYGDNQVKWVDTTRYYFVYDEPHIKNFIKHFSEEHDIKLLWDRGNWYIELIA